MKRIPVFSLVAISAFLPAIRAVTPSLRLYSTADGLVNNDINRIFSDSRGFLWFATGEGLSRFDGVSFRNYGLADGLPDTRVTDIAETQDGIWVATPVGLSRLDPDAAKKHSSLFTTYPLTAAGEQGYVLSLIAAADGHSLWCAARRGLFRFGPSAAGFAFESVALRPGGPEPAISGLYLDRDGSLWLPTRDQGLLRRLPAGRIDSLGLKEGLPSMDTRRVAADAQGRIWVGTNQGLCRLAPSLAVVDRVFIRRDGLSSNQITDLFLRFNGVLTIATANGLHSMSSAGGQSEPVISGYGANRLLAAGSLGEDHANNLWLGTFRGAVRLNERDLFLTYDEKDGLHGTVKSVLEDRSGNLCAVTEADDALGFYCSQNGVFSSVTPRGMADRPPVIFGWDQIHLQDHLGEWWIPNGRQLFRYPKTDRATQLATTTPKAIYDRRHGLPDGEVFRLFEDRSGDLWISYWNEDALVRWRRDTGAFERFPEVHGLATSFAQDNAGDVWIGFYWHNLMRFRDGRFLPFTPATGFPEGSIFGLYVDHAGRLWAGAIRGGMVRFDDPAASEPHFRLYTSREGLSSNQVSVINEDQWGAIYAVTGRGVDRLTPATGEIRHFDVTALNLAYRDRQGRLWFGSHEGLRMMTPTPESDTPVPDARISALRIRGRPWPVSEFGESTLAALRLPSIENQLQFDFFSINLDPGRKIAYQYRMEGGDREWSAPTPVPSVNIASLAPGEYRYQVRTVDSLGRTAATPATVVFQILPPVWRRWWFLTAMVSVLLLLITTAYNYRVNHLMEMVRIRTRIATDLHDDIGSSLAQIALLSEVARRENRNGEALARIGSVSRHLVDSMSDVVWAIDPRWDRASDLVSRMKRFAGEFLTASSLEYQFESKFHDPQIQLHPDTRRNVFLIYKEALHNAVKHAHSSRVSIRVSLDSHSIVLVVEDDGRGFDLKQSMDRGHGLRTMRARAADLGGDLEIRIGPAGGTCVTLRAPLTHHAPRQPYLQKRVG